VQDKTGTDIVTLLPMQERSCAALLK